MAQMVVRFDTAQMENLVRFVRQEMAKLTVQPTGPPPGLEPITIQSPTGQRALFVDEIGESHWVGTDDSPHWAAAQARGWRQAWARKAEQ